MKMAFTVKILGAQVWDPLLDNLDVEVTLTDGTRFAATFFTLQNVEKLFRKNANTGECHGGLYLWAANMILVRELSEAIIVKTVEDLLDVGEFEQAFHRLSE